jgi:hypothetical protein
MRRLPDARPAARVKYARDLRPEQDVVERTHWSPSAGTARRAQALVAEQALVASERGADQPRRSAHSSH